MNQLLLDGGATFSWKKDWDSDDIEVPYTVQGSDATTDLSPDKLELALIRSHPRASRVPHKRLYLYMYYADYVYVLRKKWSNKTHTDRSSPAANPSTRGAGTHPDHNHAIDREIN